MSKLENWLLIACMAFATIVTHQRIESQKYLIPERIVPAPRYMRDKPEGVTHAIHYKKDAYWIKISEDKIEMKERPFPLVYPILLSQTTNDFNQDGSLDYILTLSDRKEIKFVKKANSWIRWTANQ